MTSSSPGRQGRCCTSPPPAGGTGGHGNDGTVGRACHARARHVLSNWKVHDRGASMGDVSGDSAALELLRVQRGRLADRMRLPWWFQTGAAIVWALCFALPFNSRYLPHGVRIWPVLIAATAVAFLMQWGLNRATGI